MLLKVFILITLATSLCSGLYLRSKRQIEREGQFLNESVVIVDKNGNRNTGVEYEIPETKKNDTDVMEIDLDRDDGTFTFGGRFPSIFSPGQANINFHRIFDQLFQQMARRFEDMTSQMHRTFNHTTSQYPNNYNGTKEEIVTINGKQYVKKEHVIKKQTDDTSIFITSVTYEPVDDSKNETIES